MLSNLYLTLFLVYFLFWPLNQTQNMTVGSQKERSVTIKYTKAYKITYCRLTFLDADRVSRFNTINMILCDNNSYTMHVTASSLTVDAATA